MIIDGFWCEVVAQTPDRAWKFCLGAHRADTPGLAIQWLRARAAELAKALDPPPGDGRERGGVLRRFPDRLRDDFPNPGRMLRNWGCNCEGGAEIMRNLLEGQHFTLTTCDYSARYLLMIRPLVLSSLVSEHAPESDYVAA